MTKLKCGRKEVFTDEYISECLPEDFLLIKKVNNNYCIIQYPCGHTKELLVRYAIKGNMTYCKECYENQVSIKFNEYNLNYLTKFKYGSAKSSHEFRLVTCKTCGDFMFVQPNRLSSKPKYCNSCQRIEISNICNSNGCILLNRIDHSYISVVCAECNSPENIQVSNLRRYGFNCKNCNDLIKPSNTYAFMIKTDIGDFIKIGKSNHPHLRKLNFLHPDDKSSSIKLLYKIKTDTGDRAYQIERKFKQLYKEYKVPLEISMKIMASGFTELYYSEILDSLIIEFEKELHD